MKNRALKKYCDYCDEEYTAQRVDSKYCSASCRQMASKSRINGGSGYRQNHNSLPRNERIAAVTDVESNSTVNYMHTAVIGAEPNRQLPVNQSPKNEAKTSTNSQPIVNEELEKINLDLVSLKIKAETSSKIEDGFQQLYKQQLIKDLQNLLEWSLKKEVSLSLLKLTTRSIAEITRTQKEIFKNSPDNYNFLASEFIPKLKEYLKTAKSERRNGFRFSINVELIEKIQKVIEQCRLEHSSSILIV